MFRPQKALRLLVSNLATKLERVEQGALAATDPQSRPVPQVVGMFERPDLPQEKIAGHLEQVAFRILRRAARLAFSLHHD